MATQKQKRLAMEAKRAAREETLRQEGLAAQLADRERRAQATKDAQIETSKRLLARHEDEKAARKDIADAQRQRQEFLDTHTPGQILAVYGLLGSMVNDTTPDKI